MPPRRPPALLPALLGAAMLVLFALPALAQDNGSLPDGIRHNLDAPMVAPSHGMRAHSLVEQWVRRGTVPQSSETEQATESQSANQSQRINVTGLLGVQVTLRLDGITLGRSEAYRPDAAAVLDPPGPATDAAVLLQEATRKALMEVQRSLMSAHRRALAQHSTDQPLEEPDMADVADRLMVDVQLAHGVEPIEVPADAELTAVLAEFSPGYHGLYSPADTGQPGEAVIWPATALAHRSTPRGQLMRLLDARGRDPQAILELGRPGGIPLLRFEVVHVTRPQPHMPAIHLVRGNELLPPHSIGSRTLENMTNRLARHLHSRFTRQNLVRGTYHPTSNRYDPEVAETRDTGLACYALMRYARSLDRRGDSDTSATEIAGAARQAAALLGQTLLDRADAEQKPAGMALALLTLVEDIDPGEHDELRDALGEALLALYDQQTRQFQISSREAGPEPVGEGSSAVILAALASLYEQTRDQRLAAVVGAQLQALWNQLDQSPNVAAMPWVALAHHRAAKLLPEDTESRDHRATREREMGTLVDLLIERQVRTPPAIGPADVVGGFELTPGPPGAPPSPDWRTAHGLGYIALCLREPEIAADRDPTGWVISAALAGRFLAQLMMDESSCYYVRSLSDAQGGVRLALWDNRLGVATTAMSLLACVQLQDTLEHHADHLSQ